VNMPSGALKFPDVATFKSGMCSIPFYVRCVLVLLNRNISFL